MEHIGNGIKFMRYSMADYGLEEHEFIESGEFFKVIFRVVPKFNGFNYRQNQFLTLNYKVEITIKEYMNLFGVVRNTATKDLNELVDNDLLKKEKEGKSIIYRKINV